MAFEDGYRIVDSVEYGTPIPDAYQRAVTQAKTWPAAGGRAVGAGFMQLANVAAQKAYAEAQGFEFCYVPGTYSRDNDTLAGQPCLTRSDRAYRTRYGGVVPLPNNLDFLHLNHWRKTDPQWRPDLQH